MAKGKIKLNSAGIREMLKDPQLQAACTQVAANIAGRAGEGFEVQSRTYPERAGAAVVAATAEARRGVLKHNILLKAAES